MAGSDAAGCRYLVRNTNGATLGGFDTKEAADECRAAWERRYESSDLVSGVGVVVERTGAR